MTSPRLLATAACAVALVPSAVTAAGAATNDKPSAGRFSGEHSFNGSITLHFERERGIGLYLARYSVKGTLKCPDEDVRIDQGGLVTARTAARVRSNRTFRLSTVVIKLDGRFTSARRVEGDITVRTIPCSKTGGFRATLRR